VLVYCLGAAVLLALVMALTSGYDRHPDESNHLAAAVYYRDHFLPPVIGDPAVRDSYSVWGVSYLNYHWAEYFFAGKFAFLISPIVHDAKLGARLFNVFLFAMLAALFVYRLREGRELFIIASFLLVTPQVWYIFSYSNNDAFALFVAVLAAYQLAFPRSQFRKFLESHDVAPALPGGLVFGLLAGLLLVCKPNYWVFLLFAAVWLLLSFPLNRRSIQNYAVVSLAALCVFGFRVGLDLYVNGETNFAGASYINYFFNGLETKPGKLLAYQEEIAEPDFKPSTMQRERYSSRPDINMRAKGVTAFDMLKQWRWHVVSFESFTGVYGYMSIFAPTWYYKVMFLLYSLFVFYVAAAIMASRDRAAILQGVLTAITCGLSILISFYLSWSYAFQAQGRYLFPIVPMAALLVYANRKHLHGWVVNGFIAISFALSVWSFVFVGLAKINGE
jgi:hypothetical protein